MTPPRPEQPRTAAGRDALEVARSHGLHPGYWRDRILAIEREAAAAALPDVAELSAAMERVGIAQDVGNEGLYAYDAVAILAEIERARASAEFRDAERDRLLNIPDHMRGSK